METILAEARCLLRSVNKSDIGQNC
jgi:hypothetical protein